MRYVSNMQDASDERIGDCKLSSVGPTACRVTSAPKNTDWVVLAQLVCSRGLAILNFAYFDAFVFVERVQMASS